MFIFEDHLGTVFSLAFSPDGKRIVSGSGDNLVKIFDTETGAEVFSSTQDLFLGGGLTSLGTINKMTYAVVLSPMVSPLQQ